MTSPSPPKSAPTEAQRLRLVQQRWPAAAQLARLLSLAVRIEPSLLRAARLAAGLDAVVEADLWFSGIIASSGTLGISFVPAVAEALRRELAASPDERALAWKLVEEHHGQQPWSIRLEERINYLTTGPPGEASEIEDLLAAALAELHEVRARDEQAALGIARWLLAALARAPDAARATPTAAAAELAAGVHLDGRLGGTDQLARAENSELLPWLLDHLGTTVLPVRLLPGVVALGGNPPDGIPLPVPATDPLVVSVIWGSGSGAHHEHVRVSPGEELGVPVEATEVELRTLAGGGVVLRRAGIGRILVNGVDQGAGFAVADYAILTAAHVLGDWALHSGRPKDPAGSFASEAPASETQSSEGAEAGSTASGTAPDLVYIPEGGEPLNVGIVATDSELDVVLLKPERPAPAILPVGHIQPGQKWRLHVLPRRNRTGSRQGVGATVVSIGGVTTSGDPHPVFALAPQRGRGPSLPGQSGAAITLENPWGAVIGLLLAETTQVAQVEVAEQPGAEEAKMPSGLRARLHAAPIDAIVASFNLAPQITPATAALVDGKWPETQPLEDLPAPPGPVTTVAGVIARMEAIGAALPSADGLACFNRIYLGVTRQINTRLEQGFFADPAFMTYLDVAFASLYFGAADAADDPAAVPLAWRPLLEQRANTGIEPAQFALAGMNAHINHDLPLALVSTCTALATSPDAGTHFADYQRMVQLLDAAEQSVRESFESAPELAVDHHLAAVNTLIANWTINSAQDLAWNNCLLLWAVRDDPVARGQLADSLASSVALASRQLLVAV